VEKKKALKTAKEVMRAGTAPTKDGRKDDRHKDAQGKRLSRQGEAREPRRDEARPPKKDWGSTGAAPKGVPQNEVDNHKKDRDNCWRCGRPGHRTYDCFSFQTVQGMPLPPAPWKAAAVATTAPTNAPSGKRTRENVAESIPASKHQKVAAVEEMVTDLLLWTSSEESDF